MNCSIMVELKAGYHFREQIAEGTELYYEGVPDGCFALAS